jgi:hypothetical protein
MKRLVVLVWFALLNAIGSHAQELVRGDSLLTLHILGDKICAEKNTLNLSFTYYFESQSNEHLIIIDHYETCFWEKPRTDTSDQEATKGLYVVIKDDSGQVVLPARDLSFQDSTQHKEQWLQNEAFSTLYDQTLLKDWEFHTRILRPKDTYMNLFTLKLNKRKCYSPATFHFDPTRNYYLSLHYVAGEDALELINKSYLGKTDRLFVGEIRSNEVELCLKNIQR